MASERAKSDGDLLPRVSDFGVSLTNHEASFLTSRQKGQYPREVLDEELKRMFEVPNYREAHIVTAQREPTCEGTSFAAEDPKKAKKEYRHIFHFRLGRVLKWMKDGSSSREKGSADGPKKPRLMKPNTFEFWCGPERAVKIMQTLLEERFDANVFSQEDRILGITIYRKIGQNTLFTNASLLIEPQPDGKTWLCLRFEFGDIRGMANEFKWFGVKVYTILREMRRQDPEACPQVSLYSPLFSNNKKLRKELRSAY